MTSVTAINQLLEREIDERLLDWSTLVLACSHSKDCVCVHVFDMFEGTCVRVLVSLCRLCACTPLTQDSGIDYTDMS